MTVILSLFTIFSGLYIGWTIGANDAANSMGTAVGARVRTLAQAVVLVSVFGLMGALLEGSHVIKTVGKGIVPLDTLTGPFRPWSARIALSAGLAAGTWVLGCTYLRLPVSTSHAIVGAVAGAGLAVGSVPGYGHLPIRWGKLLEVFVSWITTPLGGALLAYVLYSLFRTGVGRRIIEVYVFRVVLVFWAVGSYLLRALTRDRVKMTRPNSVYGFLLTVSGCFMAFAWGANDVANSTGPIVGAGLMGPRLAALIGGLAIVFGVVTWGYKVIETIGSRITHLVPIMAFAAELASAINVQAYTMMGIPVSTSHSIVGAVFGVGLVHGRSAVDRGVLRDIVLAWVGTPFLAGALAFGINKLLLVFV